MVGLENRAGRRGCHALSRGCHAMSRGCHGLSRGCDATRNNDVSPCYGDFWVTIFAEPRKKIDWHGGSGKCRRAARMSRSVTRTTRSVTRMPRGCDAPPNNAFPSGLVSNRMHRGFSVATSGVRGTSGHLACEDTITDAVLGSCAFAERQS